MPSKKTKRKTKNSSVISKIKLLKIFLVIFLFAFLAVATSYFIMKNESPNKTITNNNILKQETKKVQEKEKPIVHLKDTFEEYTDEFHKDYFDKIEPAVIPKEVQKELPKKEEKTKNIEVIKVKEEEKQEKVQIKKDIPKEIKKEKIEEKSVLTKDEEEQYLKKDAYVYNKKDKPKIAIIIDDVSTNRQKQTILNIGYDITMAFLPPQPGHINSAKIAQNVPIHMIHFPMQASDKFKSEEKVTLKITDSYEKIEKRVKELRKLYPNAVYTNNHTGSIFTQNDEAMDKLFRALKKYNFKFVDSRTTPNSVAKKYAKKYGMPVIVRNTFIDNKREYAYIQDQLKKAIKIAKKNGYAIAIGHPHAITLKVLKESKHLLKGVEPIFINQLPYL
ncbi:divergent polysaccharide deacetylase family protein [Poseidonibacter sp.]|uniref:divergent polysaccharide deacetylase family protein n=2 Tax=Poseidonibacter sp. TaxID=2321188 RepID=UPI003C73D80A